MRSYGAQYRGGAATVQASTLRAAAVAAARRGIAARCRSAHALRDRSPSGGGTAGRPWRRRSMARRAKRFGAVEIARSSSAASARSCSSAGSSATDRQRLVERGRRRRRTCASRFERARRCCAQVLDLRIAQRLHVEFVCRHRRPRGRADRGDHARPASTAGSRRRLGGVRRGSARGKRGQPARRDGQRTQRITARSCGCRLRLRRLLRSSAAAVARRSPKPNQSRQPPPCFLGRRLRHRARRVRRLEAGDEGEPARARAAGVGGVGADRPTASPCPCRRPPAARSAGARRCADHTRIAPVAPYRPVGWFWSLPTQTTARWSPV